MTTAKKITESPLTLAAAPIFAAAASTAPEAPVKPKKAATATTAAPQKLPASKAPAGELSAKKAALKKPPVKKTPLKTPVAKPALSKALAPVKLEKAAAPQKTKKNKLVRDSFTIPKAEYLVLDELKQRAAKLIRPVKKSELLRAGIKRLAALPDAAFLSALEQVPTIKTGRPALKK